MLLKTGGDWRDFSINPQYWVLSVLLEQLNNRKQYLLFTIQDTFLRKAYSKGLFAVWHDGCGGTASATPHIKWERLSRGLAGEVMRSMTSAAWRDIEWDCLCILWYSSMMSSRKPSVKCKLFCHTAGHGQGCCTKMTTRTHASVRIRVNICNCGTSRIPFYGSSMSPWMLTWSRILV